MKRILFASLACVIFAGCSDLPFDMADPVKLDADKSTVALWHFDEGAGEPFDSSVYSNNVTAVSGATWEGGMVGKCMLFKNPGSYIEVQHSSSLNFLRKSQMTVEAWICPKRFVEHGTILAKPGQYLFQLHSDGRLGCFLYGISDKESRQFAFSKSALPVAEWTHVAFTFDGKQIRFFINGRLDSFADAPGQIEPLIAPKDGVLFNFERMNLRIGGDDNPARSFDGFIDEVRMSGKARTDNELENSYKRKRG